METNELNSTTSLNNIYDIINYNGTRIRKLKKRLRPSRWITRPTLFLVPTRAMALSPIFISLGVAIISVSTTITKNTKH